MGMTSAISSVNGKKSERFGFDGHSVSLQNVAQNNYNWIL